MMLKSIICFIFIIVGYSQTKELVLGLSPKYSKETQSKRFSLIKLFLQIKLDVEIELEFADSEEEFIENYVNGGYDFAFSSSVLFVQSRIQSSKIRPLAIVKNRDKTFYKSLLLVNKESNIKDISELNGKKIAFGLKESTSRFLVPNFLLKSKGVSYQYSFFDKDINASIKRLINKEVDAISMYKFGNASDEYRVLVESFKIPEYLFSVNTDKINKKLQEKLYKTIAAAPVIMSKKIRNSYNGFVKTRMKNFNHLLELAQFYLKEN